MACPDSGRGCGQTPSTTRRGLRPCSVADAIIRFPLTQGRKGSSAAAAPGALAFTRAGTNDRSVSGDRYSESDQAF